MLRILIVSDSPTFSEALKSLLLFERRVKIIGQELDVTQAINSTEILKPDVIILANTGLKRGTMWDEIRLHPVTLNLKIISLNLQNNEITNYQLGQKTVRVAQGVQDLIEAIKGDFSPRQPAQLMEQFSESFIASS